MSFELGTILILFGFLCGFLFAYIYYRPTKQQQEEAAKKAVEKLLKEKNVEVK